MYKSARDTVSGTIIPFIPENHLLTGPQLLQVHTHAHEISASLQALDTLEQPNAGRHTEPADWFN